MTARKDCPAVEDGNPATAAPSWAEEPMPLTAYVAGRGIEIDGVRREGKAETIADERAALADSLANAPGWSLIED